MEGLLCESGAGAMMTLRRTIRMIAERGKGKKETSKKNNEKVEDND